MTVGAFSLYDYVVDDDSNSNNPAIPNGENGWSADHNWAGVTQLTTSVPNNLSNIGPDDRIHLFSRGSAYANAVTARYTIKASVASSRYYALPAGSKIVQEFVGYNYGDGQTQQSVHVGVKMLPSVFGPTGGNLIHDTPGGYTIAMNTSGGATTVGFWKHVSEQAGAPAGVFTSLGAGFYATWMRWRLTVEDIAGNDQITVDRDLSAGRDGTGYVQQHSETILNTDPNYVPWNDVVNGQQAIGFQVGTFNAFQTDGQTQFFFHGFKVATTLP